MNTLTMALAVALLAGSGPEKVSGETRQGLNFSGEWEGTFSQQGGEAIAKLVQGTLLIHTAEATFREPMRLLDNGHGRIRVQLGSKLIVGTYRQNKGLVFIVSPDMRKVEVVLSLRLVKPRK